MMKFFEENFESDPIYFTGIIKVITFDEIRSKILIILQKEKNQITSFISKKLKMLI